MAETVESLKKQVTKLKKEVAKAKGDVTKANKAVKAANKDAAAAKKELEILQGKMEHQPRALEVLDNLTIAVEKDRAALHQSAGAAREFLDSLPADLQASFRDWHPNVRSPF